jgi:hypothetical protein
MEKTPTLEQLAFLQMLKSCIEDGFIKLNVRANPSSRWYGDNQSPTPTVNTTTEIQINLPDQCFEVEIGSHEGY